MTPETKRRLNLSHQQHIRELEESTRKLEELRTLHAQLVEHSNAIREKRRQTVHDNMKDALNTYNDHVKALKRRVACADGVVRKIKAKIEVEAGPLLDLKRLQALKDYRARLEALEKSPNPPATPPVFLFNAMGSVLDQIHEELGQKYRLPEALKELIRLKSEYEDEKTRLDAELVPIRAKALRIADIFSPFPPGLQYEIRTLHAQIKQEENLKSNLDSIRKTRDRLILLEEENLTKKKVNVVKAPEVRSADYYRKADLRRQMRETEAQILDLEKKIKA